MVPDFFSNRYIQVALLGIALLIAVQFTKRLTKKYIVTNAIEPHRRKLILNLFYIAYYFFSGLVLLLILGIEPREFAIYFSSILAVLGVAFFAQWSILSNLMASVILFFYYPIRIGDQIRIMDKDNDFTGTIDDITGFYTIMILGESKRKVIVPNIIIVYKGLQLLDRNKPTHNST